MHLFTCLFAVLHASAAMPELVQWPTDVSGSARGVNAVPFDAAAAGRVDGFELQLRQHTSTPPTALGALGLYTTLPAGPLSLYGGFEWGGAPRPHNTRGIVGLATQLGPDVWAGVAYRALWPVGQVNSVGFVDVGLFAEPASWLSISLGVDALNAPSIGTVHQPRAARVGVALRPIFGKPWLTIAADTRVVGGFGARWILPDNRVMLDVSPWEGVHVAGTFLRQNDLNTFWAAVGLDLLGSDLWGTMRVDKGAVDSGVALTLRSHPSSTILHLRGRRVEVPLDGNLHEGDKGPFNPGKMISTTVLRLDALAKDDTVEEVVLPMGRLTVGMGTADELRAAIGRLRQAGKRVVAELHSADDKTYMVAAAAERIRIDPLATLNIDGFSMTAHYFAATLSRLGIHFDAVGVGKYKSGPDALTRDNPRPEDKEVQTEILGLAQASLTEVLRADRHLEAAQVTQVLEQGMFEAEAALKAGLVDEYSVNPDPNAVQERRPQYDTFESIQRPPRRWGSLPVIAVVPVVGTIVPVGADNPMPGVAADAKIIADQLGAALDDPEVVGVVLRIDSPGGDVFASETIWRAVKRLAAHKPVVASMGDVAASGGYYAAAPAHVILAQPNSITGSIGIFTVKPDIHGLLDFVGVHSETYKSSERADWESIEHPLRDADRSRVQHNLESLYGAFVGRVAVGRHMSEARVRELAEGRVYTGARAKELGLVDGFGGLGDAVRLVQERAGLPADAEVSIDIPNKLFSLSAFAQHMAQTQAPLDGLLNDLQRRLEAWDGRVLAIMPYLYEAKP